MQNHYTQEVLHIEACTYTLGRCMPQVTRNPCYTVTLKKFYILQNAHIPMTDWPSCQLTIDPCYTVIPAPCPLTIDPCYTITPAPCQLTIDPCKTVTPHAKQYLELGQCSSLLKQSLHNYVTAKGKFTARVTIKFTARVIQFCEAWPISAISLKICTPRLQLLHNTEQRSLDMARWLTTLENFYIWKTFYLGLTTVV